MTTSEATLYAEEDRGSSRSLEDVGVDTVLGAMIEQRRRSSRPAPSEIGDAREIAHEETPRSQRVAAHSDAFLKAR